MLLIIKIKEHKLLTAHVSRVMDNKLEGVFRIDFVSEIEKNRFLGKVENYDFASSLDLQTHQNNHLFPNSLFFSNKMVTLFEVTN